MPIKKSIIFLSQTIKYCMRHHIVEGQRRSGPVSYTVDLDLGRMGLFFPMIPKTGEGTMLPILLLRPHRLLKQINYNNNNCC